MIILIPFYLLKLRNALTQSRSETNKKALKNLIENDIVNSIKISLAVGNISGEDGRKLCDMIQKLYWHIYANYEELEDITMMIDESLDLPSDIYDAKIEKLEIALEEKEAAISEKDSTINALTAEIEALKKQLEELTKNN